MLRLLLPLLFHTCLSVPFFFVEQPVDGVVQEGAEASLMCIVEPVPPGATYTWYKSDEFKAEENVQEEKLTPISGETSSVLHYPSVTRDATGYYHCKVETSDPPYRIFSSSAHFVVNYFDMPVEPITISRTFSDSTDEYLECETLTSSPEIPVIWKKDDSIVSGERFFVFPADQFVMGETVKRGTLMIINIDQDEDAGLYECFTKEEVEIGGVAEQLKLSSYQVYTTSGFSPIGKAPIIAYATSFDETGGEAQIPIGGSITLNCAATGTPTPSINWYIMGDGGDIPIRKSDSLLLEDNNKRLVASNIVDEQNYKCVVSNEVDGRRKTRNHEFFIITVEEGNFDITIKREPTPNHVLKPNQYTPFSLECYVEETGNNKIIWLKNGEKMEWNARFTADTSNRVIDGVSCRGSTLTFEASNESDLGVYQCVIVNPQRLKTLTAYVTLEKDRLSYEISTREPDYFFLPGPYYVDEAEEACNYRRAHLVSILDSTENTKVQNLANRNGADSVWIGLTREVPEPVGNWVWTLSGDIATTYSNWEQDKPDNKYGAQEYTVLTASNGKWLDVNKNTRRPAVCKLYQVVCPSIDSFYEGRVRARGWESVGATYEVGQEVEVFCRFPGDEPLNVKSVVCGQDRQFSPPKLACPKVPSSAPSFYSVSLILVLSSLILALLRTS